MVERQLSYISLFILFFLAILEGYAGDHLHLILSFVLAWGLSILAFYSGWLTLDGRFAASVVGTLVLGLGGWIPGLLLLIFFLSSSLLTRPFTLALRSWKPVNEATRSRRDAGQVWANSFWICLLSGVWFLQGEPLLLLLMASALAVVTADTWASELGRAAGGYTICLTDFRRVEPGSDGGVSVTGTLAAAAGAMLIGLAYLLLSGHLDLRPLFIVSASGLTGCMVDSYLGSALHQKRDRRTIRYLQMTRGSLWISNFINWFASGLGILIAFMLNKIL